MTGPRLAASLQIAAFIRLVEADGGFATILRKGDPVAGAILIIGLAKGQNPVIFERFPSLSGQSSWQQLGDSSVDDADITARWQKRADRDPDLWVIELDVASAERLNGLLAGFD